MKKLFKSTSSLVVALFIASVGQAATPGAIVSQVNGNAFVMSNGQTKTLSMGDRVDDFSDVVTEEGAQVTLTDYYDHKFYLSGSGHIKLERNQLSLERGFVWIQSFNQRDGFIVKTANSKVEYKMGEAIVSFDSFSGKTQLMSIRGEFDLANAIETHLKVSVGDGQFSFVSNDYNKGIPRTPMILGEGSFKKVTALFEGVQPAATNLFPTHVASAPSAPEKTVGRNIASAPEKKTGIVKLKKSSTFVNAAVISKAYQSEEKKVEAIKRKQYLQREFSTKSGVAVHIYGQKKVTAPSAQRMPASAAPAEVIKADPSFEGSLIKQYEGQMRHSNEVNQLIDELKNYEQDYQSEY